MSGPVVSLSSVTGLLTNLQFQYSREAKTWNALLAARVAVEALVPTTPGEKTMDYVLQWFESERFGADSRAYPVGPYVSPMAAMTAANMVFSDYGGYGSLNRVVCIRRENGLEREPQWELEIK